MRLSLFALTLSVVVVSSCVRDTEDALVAPAASAFGLADRIRSGDVSAEDAVTAYLSRIEAFDRAGPRLQAIIALNANARAEARVLDAEARAGKFRGPLHGVPILVKDNIETKELPTTAGSLALRQNDTGRDAPIIRRLREQGAIVLGKTNLSEWANLRSSRAIAGWSGIGGLTRNPHRLDRSPCGSSSGSGAAVAAQLAPLAIGTETSGSIICPAAMTGVVGMKPTVGLLSRARIVPVSPTQDTAGPIGRSVQDVALLLTAMAGSDPDDPITGEADERKRDYVQELDIDLDGMRLGVFRWAEGNNEAVSAVFADALSVLRAQGAILVEIDQFSPAPVLWESGDRVLRTQLKQALNAYLKTTASGVEVRSIADLIEYNTGHAERELALFGQDILVDAMQMGDIDDPSHVEALASIQRAARRDGIDRLLAEHEVELLLMPAAPLPSVVDILFTSTRSRDRIGAGWLAAMAGYPILTVPMGAHRGLPLGLAIMGTAWDDARVLAVGHAYEQAAQQLTAPTFAAGPFDAPETGESVRPFEDHGSP